MNSLWVQIAIFCFALEAAYAGLAWAISFARQATETG